MQNLTNWLRWGDNKWHLLSDNPAYVESMCGKEPAKYTSITHLESGTIPEDEFGVCLSCIRWREKRMRSLERV
jgi:hypothetical protein